MESLLLGIARQHINALTKGQNRNAYAAAWVAILTKSASSNATWQEPSHAKLGHLMKRSVSMTLGIATIGCLLLWLLDATLSEILGFGALGIFWAVLHKFSEKTD